jgi:hypothetical protein
MSSWDELERQIRDMRASDAEHSHVSGDARRRIQEIIDSEIDVAAGTGQTAEIALAAAAMRNQGDRGESDDA